MLMVKLGQAELALISGGNIQLGMVRYKLDKSGMLPTGRRSRVLEDKVAPSSHLHFSQFQSKLQMVYTSLVILAEYLRTDPILVEILHDTEPGAHRRKH